MKYDYIGAPWLSGFCEYDNLKRKVLYVGNGGFSLRNVQSCIRALQNNPVLLAKCRKRNEDVFFSSCDGNGFSVAPKKVALSFAFEREVRYCFSENDGKLPFGCHAWERYDLEFWKEFMIMEGYSAEMSTMCGGNEDRYNVYKYRLQRQNALLLENESFFYGIPLKLQKILGNYSEDGYYLWGAGNKGKSIKKIFDDLNIPLKGFVDGDINKQNTLCEGKVTYSPQRITETGGKIIVTTDNIHHKSIAKMLDDMQLNYYQDFIFWEDLLPQVDQ